MQIVSTCEYKFNEKLFEMLTFPTVWTVVDAIRNLLPTVTAKHLPDDLLQMFQDGANGGKWWAAADPFTAFSYPMVHLDNSPQPHVRTYFDFSICREVFLFAVRFFYLPWGFSICREVFLFAVRFFFLPWDFYFCRESFSFAVRFFFLPWVFFFLPWVFFFLPWGFSFCRESFSFCREVFLFAVSLFFLPWVFSFCRESFSFCREVISFAVRFSFSPWGYFFCRDSCGPPYKTLFYDTFDRSKRKFSRWIVEYLSC